jgi:hypothetical protein
MRMYFSPLCGRTAGGMIRRAVVFLIGFVFFAGNRIQAAGFEFTPNLQRAYADVLKLKVQDGRRAIGGEVVQENGVAVYVDNFADMVTLLVSDDRKLYEQWSDREDQRLDLLRDLDENSPWQRFTQAEVRLHWLLSN